MPPRGAAPDIVRIVEGVEGRVDMAMDLVLRFDYGSIVPWVRRRPGGMTAIAGPDMVRLASAVPIHGEHFTTVSDFAVEPGQRLPFALTWYQSYQAEPDPIDPERCLRGHRRLLDRVGVALQLSRAAPRRRSSGRS